MSVDRPGLLERAARRAAREADWFAAAVDLIRAAGAEGIPARELWRQVGIGCGPTRLDIRRALRARGFHAVGSGQLARWFAPQEDRA